MLTRELAINILITGLNEEKEKGNISAKDKKSLVLTAYAVTNILSTNVSDLANARLQMEGFGAYMAADKEEVYLENYFSENMKRYVEFIDDAQTRFDLILDSVNTIIDTKPRLLSKYKFTYDNIYSFWMEDGEVKISTTPSIMAKTRFNIERSLPIHVEVFEKGTLKFSSAISNLNVFVNN